MLKLLVALHAGLVLVMFFPVYEPWGCCDLIAGWHTPFDNALNWARCGSGLKSVAAAVLPSLAALVNLPILLLMRKPLWNSASSAALGVLSVLGWGQLLARYGAGGHWGLFVGIPLALALALAGTWALARRPAAQSAASA